MVSHVSPIDWRFTKWQSCGHRGECLMQFSKQPWGWVVSSSLYSWGSRGSEWPSDLPSVASLNWISGPAGTKAQALCMRSCCLPRESWSRMRAHFPCSRCFCIVPLHRALFSLCPYVWIKQRRWWWELVLSLELNLSLLPPRVLLAFQGEI